MADKNIMSLGIYLFGTMTSSIWSTLFFLALVYLPLIYYCRKLPLITWVRWIFVLLLPLATAIPTFALFYTGVRFLPVRWTTWLNDAAVPTFLVPGGRYTLQGDRIPLMAIVLGILLLTEIGFLYWLCKAANAYMIRREETAESARLRKMDQKI
jgi:hypothetical protein